MQWLNEVVCTFSFAGIFPRFLVWVRFNRHNGNNICQYTSWWTQSACPCKHKCYSLRLPGTYPSPRDQNNLYFCLHDEMRTQLAVWTGTVYPESHDSMKQSMLKFLISLWKVILDPELIYFIVQNWTLASIILGSGGWCARLLSRTRSPLRLAHVDFVQMRSGHAGWNIANLSWDIPIGLLFYLKGTR